MKTRKITKNNTFWPKIIDFIDFVNRGEAFEGSSIQYYKKVLWIYGENSDYRALPYILRSCFMFYHKNV